IAVMNAGVLEQMDAPEEIYARPATLFVATFIGTMNRLDAFVDGDTRLRAGPFELPTPDGPRPEGILVAGVRPADLVLESRGDGPAARIDQAIDLGHYRRVSLSVDGTNLLAFVPKGEELPTEDVTVRVRRVL